MFGMAEAIVESLDEGTQYTKDSVIYSRNKPTLTPLFFFFCVGYHAYCFHTLMQSCS